MKKYILYTIFFLSLCTVGNAQTKGQAVSKRADTTTVSQTGIANMIVSFGMNKLGSPYKSAGSGPNAFDCSGFVWYVFSNFGYNIKRSSAQLSKEGTAVEGPFSNMRKGDLVFFSSTANSKTVSHVGIFIETAQDGKDFVFIHSASKGGVRLDYYSEPYYTARFVCARRIIDARVATAKLPGDYSASLEKLPALPSLIPQQMTKVITADHDKHSDIVPASFFTHGTAWRDDDARKRWQNSRPRHDYQR